MAETKVTINIESLGYGMVRLELTEVSVNANLNVHILAMRTQPEGVHVIQEEGNMLVLNVDVDKLDFVLSSFGLRHTFEALEALKDLS